MKCSGSYFHIIGLHKGTTLVCPVLLQCQNKLLKGHDIIIQELQSSEYISLCPARAVGCFFAGTKMHSATGYLFAVLHSFYDG
jgi:hypothetical protein